MRIHITTDHDATCRTWRVGYLNRPFVEWLRVSRYRYVVPTWGAGRRGGVAWLDLGRVRIAVHGLPWMRRRRLLAAGEEYN